MTGNDALAYRGNADDALATQGGPWGVNDTSQSAQASRDLALMAVQRNKSLYEQRIKDRDKVYQMMDDDQLIPKDMLDVDRSRVQDKLQNIQDLFLKYNGDITSSPDRWQQYTRAIQQAKSDINQAQKRYVGVTADMAQRAKAGNPIAEAAYDKHIAEYLKDPNSFYKPYQPYTPLTDFSLETVRPKPEYNSVTSQEGLYNVKTDTVNTDKLLDTVRANYANPQYNHMFTNAQGTGYLDMLMHAPRAQADQMVSQWNSGLDKHNKDLGLKPGDPGYVTPLQVIPVPGGGYQVAGHPADAAAKIVLAETPAKVVTKEFDKDRAGNKLNWSRLDEDIRHNKATEGLEKDKLDAEKAKWDASVKGTEGTKTAAWQFAQHTFESLKSMADENGVITPDKLRQLNSEQLQFMGNYQEVDGKKTWIPLFGKVGSDGKSIDMSDLQDHALQINSKTGEIKAMKLATTGKKDAQGNPEYERSATDGYKGEWKPEYSTTLSNIATNRITYENINSSGKESNAYLAADSQGQQNQTSPSTTEVKLKQTYSKDGKDYTLDDLHGMGYKDEDIKQAFKNGKLK